MASITGTKRSARQIRQPDAASELRHSYVFPTECGWMAVCWTGPLLRGFTLGHPSAAAALATLGDGADPTDSPPAFVRRLAERIQAYASGVRDDFRDVPLDLSHLTEFQQRVVEQCRRIRPGQTLSYAELAAQAGYPGAARAVGNTMARNRFPIVVPCHRVVGAGGTIGGFSAPSGISLKQKLLVLEGSLGSRRKKPR
ncbi:MAG TPA: methylated-DNA--[protein]-cysteine S-methyltransferase [Pirellulaceae bacterium]|nr:methylated-DNA--[protein]-cysteine S-methyltransferase [Pirellulaceae bacterium]